MTFTHPEIIAVLMSGYGFLVWIVHRSLSKNDVLEKRVEHLEKNSLMFQAEIKADFAKINQKLDKHYLQMIEILKDKN